MIHAKLAVTLRPRLYTRQTSPKPKMTHHNTRLCTRQSTPLRVSQKRVIFQDTANEITLYNTPE